MNQGNYSTAYQTLAMPVLDLTNPQSPTYTSAGGQIKTLAPACYRIAVKNTITISGATIVVCSDTTVPGDCTDPGSCPTSIDLATPKYYNLMATVTANVQQISPSPQITIEFNYLYNDAPVITDIQKSFWITTAEIAGGGKTIYLFDTNKTLYPDDTVTLYGARVVGQ